MGSMSNEQTEVYRLVAEFVTRQELAYQVLRRFRPNLVPEPGERPPRLTREQATATQCGRWGEWRYGIHGSGCEMVHEATGEPIQWNSPDVRRFDPHWLIDWVTWCAARGACAIDPAEVPRVLVELTELGLLRHHPGRTNCYELLMDRP